MLRVIAVLCTVLLLFCGCSTADSSSDHGLALREKLGDGCSFTANIVADYSENSYSFTMNCRVDESGGLTFDVVSPDSISGITGSISSSGGRLTFDDAVLAFPLLADGEISPVTAPWLCIRSLIGGYLRSSGSDGAYVRLTLDDSFVGENLLTDIWLADGDVPQYAEILWNGRKMLSVRFENFRFA